jgi:hypothetical protein
MMSSMLPELEEYALLLRARRRYQVGPRSRLLRLRRLLQHWPPPTIIEEASAESASGHSVTEATIAA